MNAYRFTSDSSYEQLSTVQEQLLFLASKPDAASTSDLADFLDEWKEAVEVAQTKNQNHHYMNIDSGKFCIDVDAKIFWIPDEIGELYPCFIWNDTRDDSTWVVSRIELPWIKELDDKYMNS